MRVDPVHKQPSLSHAGQTPLGTWKPPHLTPETPPVNQNGMTSCVMAAEARGKLDPVFVLKLIGGSMDDGGSEECVAPLK